MGLKIWGFDLSEMSWSAFGHKSMFDRRWCLRAERFVIYQLAMLVCLAAECTATYSLSKYDKLKKNIHDASSGEANLYNDGIVATTILTIVFGVLVATIFGADFFFLLFFPARNYPPWYHATRMALALIITAGLFVAVLSSTIVVGAGAAFVRGVPQDVAWHYEQYYNHPPFVYSQWPTNVAFVALLWVGFIFTSASAWVMHLASEHDLKYGAGIPGVTPASKRIDVHPARPPITVTLEGSKSIDSKGRTLSMGSDVSGVYDVPRLEYMP